MPASSKFRLTAGALVVALGSYAVLATGLERAAFWAETSFAAYPYRGGEEPIRWLMPTISGRRRPRVMIAGPSAVGEDLRYEELVPAVAGRVVPGALSNGTLDDVTLGLEYLERAFGADALPEYVVLGMTMRVLANYPRNFGPGRDPEAYAPLIETINRYSTGYSVETGLFGTHLRRKSFPERLTARLHWFTKQQTRNRTAVLAALEYVIDPDPLKIGFQDGLPYFADLRAPLSRQDGLTMLRYARSVGLTTALWHWLPAYRSAYYHTFMAPVPESTVIEEDAGWRVVYDWDPDDEREMVHRQLGRLRQLLERHSIGLVVIYLPEHPLSRREYDPTRVRHYRDTIERELPQATIIDLWDTLTRDQFYDQIHAAHQGARIVTKIVADSLNAHGVP